MIFFLQTLKLVESMKKTKKNEEMNVNLTTREKKAFNTAVFGGK